MFRLFLLCALAALSAAKYTKLELDSCGGDGIRINEVDVSPMPVKFPGRLNVLIDADLTRPLNDKVKVKVSMWSKTWLGWIKNLLCIKNVGSCTYDLCELLESQGGTCPKEVTDLGLSCTCPFKSTHVRYALNNIELPPIPSALKIFADGDFWIKAEVFDSGKLVSCFDVKLTIES
ncbi:ganglioside GM2 activator-like [Lineus longissimus]|uniref:ganglioside GM2 activator-like n=1 Tax=Lineus longissimus TaxID=88925 RepID=UPI002B4E0072